MTQEAQLVIGLTRKELDEMYLGGLKDALMDQRYKVDGHGNAYFYPINDVPGLSLKYRWLFLANYTKVKDKLSLSAMQRLYAPYKYQDILAIQTLLNMDRYSQALVVKDDGIDSLSRFVSDVLPLLDAQKLTSQEVILYQLASVVVNDFGKGHDDYTLSPFRGDELYRLDSLKEFVNDHVMDIFRMYVKRVENDMRLRNLDINAGKLSGPVDLLTVHSTKHEDDIKSVIMFLHSLRREVTNRPNNNSVLSVGWDLAHDLQKFIYKFLIERYYVFTESYTIDKHQLAQNFKDVYGYTLDVDRLVAVEKRVYRFFRPGAESSKLQGVVASVDDRSQSASASQLFPVKADKLDDGGKSDLSHISAHQIVDDTIAAYQADNSESSTPSAVSTSAMPPLVDFTTDSSAVASTDESLEHPLTKASDDSEVTLGHILAQATSPEEFQASSLFPTVNDDMSSADNSASKALTTDSNLDTLDEAHGVISDESDDSNDGSQGPTLSF